MTDIVLRRDESKRYMRLNYYDEWTEVWRAIKCRTVPIKKRDAAGKETEEEDKTRTNVSMGLTNLVYRRNVARLSARPYSLRVIGGQDPTVAPRLSALLSQQYDRSQEQIQDVRVRMAAEALGVGYSKVMWDYVSREMIFRRALMKGNEVILRDRKSIMQAQGASDSEIENGIAQFGSDMSDQEIAQYIGKSGTEITVPQKVTKYEGPCVKFVFNGDLHIEPFAKRLYESSYVIESYQETDLWLKKQLNLTYKDPDTGQEMKAFDPTAVKALIDLDPSPLVTKGLDLELRDLFRGATAKQSQLAYQFPRNLRVRKVYDILEQHAADENGRMWITWVSEIYRDKPLGRMPYPWDLYGATCYTEENPLPDLIDSVGDSTPRLMRHQVHMFDMQTAQNFDYISNLLRKVVLVKTGVEFDSEVIERALFRIVKCTNPDGVKYLEDPGMPAGAMERGPGLLQVMGMFEPSLNSVDAGTATSPMAGKTATTAVLGAKAADVLLQFKMDGRNLYLSELGMKKLWMNQQAAEDDWTIEQKYWGQELSDSVRGLPQDTTKPGWALSDRMGKTTAVTLSPLHELQEDFDIEPEAGSYMAVDDDIRRQSAMDLDQVAMQAPNIIDIRKAVRFHLSTIRGIGNPDDYILPQTPPGPPPPKVNFNIGLTGKMEDLPQLTAEVLSQYGIQPTPDLQEQSQANQLKDFSDAADHADNLLTVTGAEHGPETGPGVANKIPTP